MAALPLTRTEATMYTLSLQEAELPLWLRPFDVLVTSNKTALIELIPDALSIHTIKAKSPPGTTLVDHFMAMHGQVSSHPGRTPAVSMCSGHSCWPCSSGSLCHAVIGLLPCNWSQHSIAHVSEGTLLCVALDIAVPARPWCLLGTPSHPGAT